MTHYNNVCEYGHLHGTCRCPSKNKTVKRIECAFPKEHSQEEGEYGATVEIRPRRIDFRKTFWGHNHTLETIGDGVLKGFVWVTPKPQIGNEVIWKTGYGEAVGIIIESEWLGNVSDMYKITVQVIERIKKCQP